MVSTARGCPERAPQQRSREKKGGVRLLIFETFDFDLKQSETTQTFTFWNIDQKKYYKGHRPKYFEI